MWWIGELCVDFLVIFLVKEIEGGGVKSGRGTTKHIQVEVF